MKVNNVKNIIAEAFQEVISEITHPKYNSEELDRLDLIAHKEFGPNFLDLDDEQKKKVLQQKDKVGVYREQNHDELSIGKVKNIEIFVNDQSSVTDTQFYRLVDNNSGKEFEVSVDVAGEEVDLNYVKEEIPILVKIGFPHGDAIGNYIVKDINDQLDDLGYIDEKLNESLVEKLDEAEEDEAPEDKGKAPEKEEEEELEPEDNAVLEDATDQIIAKFPTLKATIIKLQTEEFKEFVESIDWISPRPTEFRVNLKNGQDYILKWTGKGFEAQILGKRYFLNNIAEYQQALDKLAILYKEGPLKGAGEEEAGEAGDGAEFGGGGGGDFPGDDAAGGEEGDTAADDTGEEEGGADLSGEPVDFEDGAEPET